MRLLDVSHRLASNLVSPNQIHSQGYWWESWPNSNILRRLDDSTVAKHLDQHDQFILEFIPEDHHDIRTTFFVRTE